MQKYVLQLNPEIVTNTVDCFNFDQQLRKVKALYAIHIKSECLNKSQLRLSPYSVFVLKMKLDSWDISSLL